MVVVTKKYVLLKENLPFKKPSNTKSTRLLFISICQFLIHLFILLLTRKTTKIDTFSTDLQQQIQCHNVIHLISQ